MIVAGWADGYRNNSFRTVEALREAGVPHRLLAGPWAHADPTTRDARPAHRPRSGDGRAGGTGGCAGRGPTTATPDRRRRVRAHLDPPGAGPRPARRALGARGVALAARRPPRHAAARRPAPAYAVEPDVGIDGLDRLRRPPAVGAVRRPARRRRRVAGLGVGAADGSGLLGHPRVRLGSAPTRPAARCRSSCATCSPTAPRRWSPAGSLDLAYRDGVHTPAPRHRWCPGRSTTSRSSSTPAPTSSTRPAAAAVAGRCRLAEHRRSPGAGHADGARRLARAAGVDGRTPPPSPTFAAGDGPLVGGPADGVTWTVDARRAAPHDHLRRRPRRGRTTCPTTAGPPSTTPAGRPSTARTFAQHADARLHLRAELARRRRPRRRSTMRGRRDGGRLRRRHRRQCARGRRGSVSHRTLDRARPALSQA